MTMKEEGKEEYLNMLREPITDADEKGPGANEYLDGERFLAMIEKTYRPYSLRVLTRKCFQKAADLGHPKAALQLARMCRYGLHGELPNQSAATVAYNQAIASGSLKATEELKEMES